MVSTENRQSSCRMHGAAPATWDVLPEEIEMSTKHTTLLSTYTDTETNASGDLRILRCKEKEIFL